VWLNICSTVIISFDQLSFILVLLYLQRLWCIRWYLVNIALWIRLIDILRVYIIVYMVLI